MKSELRRHVVEINPALLARQAFDKESIGYMLESNDMVSVIKVPFGGGPTLADLNDDRC